jgi:hypothetical protein
MFLCLTNALCIIKFHALFSDKICLLQNQGIDISDSELLGFISESSTMSKSLVDYGDQKSCAVTTAKRLAEFLGDSMVKDKGLHCQYIVAREPQVSTEVLSNYHHHHVVTS